MVYINSTIIFLVYGRIPKNNKRYFVLFPIIRHKDIDNNRPTYKIKCSSQVRYCLLVRYLSQPKYSISACVTRVIVVLSQTNDFLLCWLLCSSQRIDNTTRTLTQESSSIHNQSHLVILLRIVYSIYMLWNYNLDYYIDTNR